MLTIQTKSFVKELEWVSRFAETKSTIPILSNVMLTATAGSIQLTGTDLEMGAIGQVEASGSILPVTFPASALLKYLKRVDESEVRLSTIDTHFDAVEAVAAVEGVGEKVSWHQLTEEQRTAAFAAYRRDNGNTDPDYYVRGVLTANEWDSVTGKAWEGVEAVEAVEAHSVAHTLVVEHGDDSRATFAGLGISSFPALPSDGRLIGDIKGLRAALPRIRIAISKEESRFTLNGALLHMDGDTVEMCSTDGHRLSLCQLQSSYRYCDAFNALVPSAAIAELDRLKLDSVQISADEHHLFFDFGARRIVARKLTGNFPDYQRVMPKEFTYHAVVNTESLSKALKRVSVMADERSRCTRWTFNGKLTIHSTLSDTGSASASVPVSYRDDVHPEEDWASGFKWDYTLEALAHMPESSLFCFSKPGDAAELVTADWRYVVMPMRV